MLNHERCMKFLTELINYFTVTFFLGFVNVSEDQSKAEQCIHQVLNQLKALRNIWKDILPVSIYNKSLGKSLYKNN